MLSKKNPLATGFSEQRTLFPISNDVPGSIRERAPRAERGARATQAAQAAQAITKHRPAQGLDTAGTTDLNEQRRPFTSHRCMLVVVPVDAVDANLLENVHDNG